MLVRMFAAISLHLQERAQPWYLVLKILQRERGPVARLLKSVFQVWPDLLQHNEMNASCAAFLKWAIACRLPETKVESEKNDLTWLQTKLEIGDPATREKLGTQRDEMAMALRDCLLP